MADGGRTAPGAPRLRADEAVARDLRPPVGTNRIDVLDASRASFVLLGIVFHAALPYRTDTPWQFLGHGGSDVLAALTAFLHSFRLPGFFAMAGMLSELTIRRGDPTKFLRRRLVRLGVPFLLTLLTFNVVESGIRNWAAARACVGTQCARDAGFELHVGHLWFLIVLVVCTIGFVLVRPACSRIGERIASLVGGPAAALAATATAYTLWTWASWRIPPLPADTPLAFAYANLPQGVFFFFLGVLAAHSTAVVTWCREAPTARTLAILVPLGVASLAAAHLLAQPSIRLGRALLLFADCTATVALLGAGVVASTALQRRVPRATAFAARHAYGVYLFHQCFVVAIAAALYPLNVNPLLGFVVTLSGAAAAAFTIAAGGKRAWAALRAATGTRAATPRSRPAAALREVVNQRV